MTSPSEPKSNMQCEEIIQLFQSMASEKDREGMARFGIRPAKALGGISMPFQRKLAKQIGQNHELAEDLWVTGIHEARTLAALVDNPADITEDQMERWVLDFDSWDICDICCNNLFDKTEYAYKKVREWSERDEEYVKRSAFSLMASLSVHDKCAENEIFMEFLGIISQKADDERNYVKKAVNWALRQIGKRNIVLYGAAIETAEQLRLSESRAARWVASDALRELKDPRVVSRIKLK